MSIVQGDSMWSANEAVEKHTAHTEWALSLKEGDRVLTNYNEDIWEHHWTLEELQDWQEVTIEKVWRANDCESGVLVMFKEYPGTEELEHKFDSQWIKPLGETK